MRLDHLLSKETCDAVSALHNTDGRYTAKAVSKKINTFHTVRF